ncbi:inositol monophosphatase family protein [Coraliomargarita sp. SDUM461003]|uniref:Inositol monophosphatase family protein n=1 Tax=Thalassobacterium maritimum TaxID=3041265 RepID=A0ABU1AU65_9BACT|nr:inositol monophosphatase family protein [Coraliomargarita sp. SDUM461003]MDQ8207709.1 inositol monophosphatase family protein [Coraliomargarita sp. SDUM461003]
MIENQESIRTLLCELQQAILKAILAERARSTVEALATVSQETAADTIYAIDRVAETTIHSWLCAHWPSDQPVEIVMEGLEDGAVLTYPLGTPVGETRLKCIIDPIDGTRGIMYDKRAAWILAGVAAQRGADTSLADIEVAVMTEIPTTRQWRADQVSAIRGCGVRAVAIDVRDGFSSQALQLQPSRAHEVRHAFGTVSRFFPAGLALLSRVEEALWDRLYGQPDSPSPLVFNDQYISSGGQFYEILAGHDRFVADLRPEAFAKLGILSNLACHPYDVATALILQEAGCVVEKPDGQPLDCPLDTTTPVSWAAYANPELADTMRPALQAVIAEYL